MAREAVALGAPAVRPANGEHAGVLAGAVVLQPRRRVPLGAALEVVLPGMSAGEEEPDGRQLL